MSLERKIIKETFKEEKHLIKDKYFSSNKQEIINTYKINRQLIKRSYFKDNPLVELSDDFNINFKDKFGIILSKDEFYSKKSTYDYEIYDNRIKYMVYNILVDNKVINIQQYNIKKSLNGK